MRVSFDQAPNNPKADEETLRDIVKVINNIMLGKTNNAGTVTLAASATTTSVTSIVAGGNSVITFMPTTANAAAEIGAGGMYISDRGKQNFEITHANNAQADRTFDFTVVG